MKKSFSLILVLLIGAEVFASSFVNLFTPEAPEISILNGLQVNIKPDEKNQNLGFSTVLSINMKELCTDFGFKVAAGKMDAVAKIIYWPTFFGKINVGTGITYHFYEFEDSFTEHDLLGGLYLFWKKGPVFDLYTRFNYMAKMAVIPAVYSAKPVVLSQSFNFEFVVRWTIYDRITVFSSFCTNSYFDYPLFITPFFSSGFEAKIVDHVNAGFDISSKWLDMFTVPSNMTQFDITLFCRMTI